MGDLMARPLVCEVQGAMSHTIGSPVPRAASVRFEWDECDPMAVRAQFRDVTGAACWVFGRDLLIGPLMGPTAKTPSLNFGHGDVVTRYSSGHVSVMLRTLGEPSVGAATFMLPAGPVQAFVAASLRRVPLASERRVYAGLVDAAITEMLGTE